MSQVINLVDILTRGSHPGIRTLHSDKARLITDILWRTFEVHTTVISADPEKLRSILFIIFGAGKRHHFDDIVQIASDRDAAGIKEVMELSILQRNIGTRLG